MEEVWMRQHLEYYNIYWDWNGDFYGMIGRTYDCHKSSSCIQDDSYLSLSIYLENQQKKFSLQRTVCLYKSFSY